MESAARGCLAAAYPRPNFTVIYVKIFRAASLILPSRAPPFPPPLCRKLLSAVPSLPLPLPPPPLPPTPPPPPATTGDEKCHGTTGTTKFRLTRGLWPARISRLHGSVKESRYFGTTRGYTGHPFAILANTRQRCQTTSRCTPVIPERDAYSVHRVSR